MPGQKQTRFKPDSFTHGAQLRADPPGQSAIGNRQLAITPSLRFRRFSVSVFLRFPSCLSASCLLPSVRLLTCLRTYMPRKTQISKRTQLQIAKCLPHKELSILVDCNKAKTKPVDIWCGYDRAPDRAKPYFDRVFFLTR